MFLVIAMTFLSSLAYSEETKPVNEELVKTLESVLSEAKKGNIYQMFLVTTGTNGVSYSFNSSEQSELVLIGSVDWAKAALVNQFDERQKKSKKGE